MTCPHGEVAAAACLDCINGVPSPQPGWQAIGQPFRARFPGRCVECDGDVMVGNMVQRWDRADRTVYLHVGCGVPA